ncbi:hypothetical protein MYIN104542_19770 [Mycobacterium intermedium]
MAVLVWLPAVGCEHIGGGSDTAQSRPDPIEPVPGIAATSSQHIPPNATRCVVTPGDGEEIVAAVADPTAPRITMRVPDGWAAEEGTGDIALVMSGPHAMSATVRIAPTDPTPESAFLRYTAALGGAMQRLKFVVTGAQFCGYSSEILSGILRGESTRIDFADRITHIRTNTNHFLVTIHVEAPADTADFGAAKAVLLQDFGVVIP